MTNLEKLMSESESEEYFKQLADVFESMFQNGLSEMYKTINGGLENESDKPLDEYEKNHFAQIGLAFLRHVSDTWFNEKSLELAAKGLDMCGFHDDWFEFE